MELNRCSVNAEKMLKQQLRKCGHFRRIEVLFNVLLTGEFYKLLCHIHFRKQFSGGFCKIGVLQNFAKFRGKHVCQSLFFKKVQAWELKLYLKRDSGTSVFLWILWNLFSIEHIWWLLLHFKVVSWDFRRFSPRKRKMIDCFKRHRKNYSNMRKKRKFQWLKIYWFSWERLNFVNGFSL